MSKMCQPRRKVFFFAQAGAPSGAQFAQFEKIYTYLDSGRAGRISVHCNRKTIDIFSTFTNRTLLISETNNAMLVQHWFKAIS